MKREINIESKPPVHIYWGKINDATTTSWEVYSMRRSATKESFSQVLFRALNIPDSDSDVNLTMHQILRIIYIDQLSPVTALMRPEPFDSIIIREAISKTLMGAYDIQLLIDENELKRKKSEMEKYQAEINSIRYILKENGSNMSIEDKGMEEIRSHNFQLNLYKRSQQFKEIEHQIIITTSMIEPSLNIPEICIGDFYTNESKSLKIEV